MSSVLSSRPPQSLSFLPSRTWLGPDSPCPLFLLLPSLHNHPRLRRDVIPRGFRTPQPSNKVYITPLHPLMPDNWGISVYSFDSDIFHWTTLGCPGPTVSVHSWSGLRPESRGKWPDSTTVPRDVLADRQGSGGGSADEVRALKDVHFSILQKTLMVLRNFGYS